MATVKSIFILFFGVFFLLMPVFSYASVAINEVLFNPSGDDRGLEFIEIYNSGDSEEDLSQWQVYPDGIGYFSFPNGFRLGSKKFVTLRLRAFGVNSQSDFYFPEASPNMGNTSGSVAIFSGSPRGSKTIKSFVQWGRDGETWESDAEEAGLWVKGAYIDTTNLIEGNSIGLIQDGASIGAGSWKIFNSPTRGLINNQSNIQSNTNENQAVSQNQSSSVESSPSSQPGSEALSSQSLTWPVIKVFAGVDKVATVGSLTEFSGNAFGSKDEPLENARYWWNFGDGASTEGNIVSYIFQSPGSYTVGLHVSSGNFSASDYSNVLVVKNQIAIIGVLVGGGGRITINNPAESEVDIGEWVMEDNAGKIFVIPSKTKIGGKSEIAFMNAVTGLLEDKFSLPVSMRYPNGSLALKWNESQVLKLSPDTAASVVNKNPFADGNNSLELDQSIEPSSPDESGVKNDLNKTAFAAAKKADRWLFLASAVGLGILAALFYFFAKKS